VDCGDYDSAVTYYYDNYIGGFFTDYDNLTTNATGRRTGMDDDSGKTYWTYDARGRLISEAKQIDGYAGFFNTGWTYNNGDQLVGMTYPNGEEVDFTYLPQGLPNQVQGDATYMVGGTYDASGRPVRQQFKDANSPLNLDYAYWPWDEPDGFGRLMSIQATEPDSSSLGDLLDLYYGNSGSADPGYDAVGNITRIETATGSPSPADTQTYTYDDLDRLKSWTFNDGSTNFTDNYDYDEFGRLKGLPDPGNYTYPTTS
jgi:YD repeat-containing protein